MNVGNVGTNVKHWIYPIGLIKGGIPDINLNIQHDDNVYFDDP